MICSRVHSHFHDLYTFCEVLLTLKGWADKLVQISMFNTTFSAFQKKKNLTSYFKTLIYHLSFFISHMKVKQPKIFNLFYLFCQVM